MIVKWTTKLPARSVVQYEVCLHPRTSPVAVLKPQKGLCEAVVAQGESPLVCPIPLLQGLVGHGLQQRQHAGELIQLGLEPRAHGIVLADLQYGRLEYGRRGQTTYDYGYDLPNVTGRRSSKGWLLGPYARCAHASAAQENSRVPCKRNKLLQSLPMSYLERLVVGAHEVVHLGKGDSPRAGNGEATSTAPGPSQEHPQFSCTATAAAQADRPCPVPLAYKAICC